MELLQGGADVVGQGVGGGDGLVAGLDFDGVVAAQAGDELDLPAALARLEDSGRMIRPELRPTREQPHPPRPLVLRSTSHFTAWGPFNRIDALAADIIACIRTRGDSFESDEQLVEWLASGVTYTGEDLSAALLQLQISGLLRRPPEEGWGIPQPGYLSTPSLSRTY